MTESDAALRKEVERILEPYDPGDGFIRRVVAVNVAVEMVMEERKRAYQRGCDSQFVFRTPHAYHHAEMSSGICSFCGHGENHSLHTPPQEPADDRE